MSKQLRYAVLVVFTLFGLVFQTIPAMAQEVSSVIAVEPKEVFQPKAAEPPIVVNAAGEAENDLSCYWRVVIDELIPWGARTSNLMYETVDNAYSGASIFKQAQSGDVYITLKASFETGDADLIFVRGWTRGSTDGASAYNYINGNLFDQIQSSSDWARHEKVLSETTGDVTFNMSVFSVGSTGLQFDQVGIGYCYKLPEPADENIEVVPPGEISQLIAPLIVFGGTLYNHGTSAAVAFSKQEGLLSYAEMWNRGIASQVLNRKWLLNGNPNGWTQGEYLGDMLWMSKDQAESWYHAARVSTTRCFDSEICLGKIVRAEQKIAGQVNAGHDEAADVTRFYVQYLKGQWSHFQKLVEQGKEWSVSLPMQLTFEMKQSEMSKSFDGGRYEYALNGVANWKRLRAVSFPSGSSLTQVKEVYRQLVNNGAPRTIKVVVGEVELQISLWERYTGPLRNIGVPQLVAWGGSAATLTIGVVRNALTLGAEYSPHLFAASAAGDLTGTMANYLIYGDTSQYEFSEFLVLENSLSRVLWGLGVVQLPTESNIGISSNYSVMQFCIPSSRKVFNGFDLKPTTLVHPEICAGQMWKASLNDKTIILEKQNTDVWLELHSEYPGASYSQILYDPIYGAVFIDFWVRSKYSNNETAVVTVSFTGFRTPEDYGMCPGWLPQEKAIAFNRAECPYNAYLPSVANGR